VTPVPRRICNLCGEFLPHSCAPIITIRREKWTGRRIITITDRAPIPPLTFKRQNSDAIRGGHP